MLEAELLKEAAQFGVAGLMGVLWVWERSMSRKRAEQLDEAHRRLVSRGSQLRMMVQLIRENTRAVEQFTQAQTELRSLVELISHDVRHFFQGKDHHEK